MPSRFAYTYTQELLHSLMLSYTIHYYLITNHSVAHSRENHAISRYKRIITCGTSVTFVVVENYAKGWQFAK